MFCSGCGLGNGGDFVMPLSMHGRQKCFHPRMFNGVMEVVAILMGGVNIRYTA